MGIEYAGPAGFRSPGMGGRAMTVAAKAGTHTVKSYVNRPAQRHQLAVIAYLLRKHAVETDFLQETNPLHMYPIEANPYFNFSYAILNYGLSRFRTFALRKACFCS